MNLGNLHLQLADLEAAEGDFATALRLDRTWIVAYVNLADLHRQRGREDLCAQVLRTGLQQDPTSGELQHAMGLCLVRRDELPAAMVHLQRAAQLRPDLPRFSYTYALALDAAGKKVAAIEILQRAQQRHPWDRDLLYALATLQRDAGRRQQALGWAQKLLQLDPESAGVRQLVEELQAR